MLKPLVVLAIVANTVLITPSEGTNPCPYSNEKHGHRHRKCKGLNEVHDVCPDPCPPRECGINKALILCAPPPKPGSSDCKPGCTCADGFLRNRAGVCIPENECKYDCARNETLDPCLSDCPPRFCGINIAAVSCLAIDECDCQRGCRCSDGFLRNGEGNCVLEKDCPTCSGLNEMYDVCPPKCPPRKCGVDDTLIDCAPSPNPGDPECEPGCRCADGFVRNYEGVCVTKDQCPKCGPREVFDICPAPCPPRRCDVDERVIRCAKPPEPGDPACKPGCRCEDGFVRNARGICVTRDQCPYNCGPYEIYSECPTDECRPLDCTQVGFPVSCPLDKDDDDECPVNPACICDYGYARSENGTCIPIRDCPPVCGRNEVYSNCTNGDCRPKNCGQLGFPIKCPRINPVDCVKGCLCKEGYVRAANGVCIRKERCPSCGGDRNATAGCGVNCGRLCSNYNKGPVSCIAVCYNNACDCKKGFVLDESTGKCILPNQCVSCRGDFHAKPGCDKDCTKRCPGPKPAECKCYKDGCVCKDGFVYDPKVKKCVRPKQCTPPCGNNEVLSNCSNGGCGPWTCDDVDFPTGCVKMDQKYCTVGCVCKEGHVRKNGVCGPITDCPKCKGKNEYYDPCPPSCPPQNCESIGRNYFCPLQANQTSKDCQGACRCKPNFFRNKIGECISAKDCQKCNRPNEYHSCGGACDNVCATLKKQNQTHCPIINIQCNSMCYCEDGYARNASNICIPIEQCPENKCGANERWEQCPARLCTPQSCSDLGFDLECLDMGDGPCPTPPGCVCDYNYVRDATGKCIPDRECPSCGGDDYAERGCGLNCGRLCSNYNKGPVPCPRICYPNSCDCKKGYVFDENTKKCVRPKDCTPVCGKHELYSECTNGGCEARNCTQLGKPVPCVKLDVNSCKKGCVCEKGYLRARNGTCVLEEKCDHCNRPYEHYESCPPSCPPQSCDSIGRQYKCPPTAAVCRGSCRCDKGYLRNKNGECILRKNCMKCKGPKEYYSCGGACDNVCETLHIQNQTNCPVVNIKCNEMCYCEKGYARDKNNICIPIDKCPKPVCGVNERLEQCPPALCTPQKCSELGFPYPCVDLPTTGCPEPPGCVCIDDYVRDAKGKCIPNQNCPSCGGDSRAISGCGLNCGRTCADYNRTDTVCPAVCYFNACDCRKGYVYDANIKKCVKPKDCTPICGKNQVYDSCANGGCSKRNCTQIGQPDLCIDVIKCIGGCVCQKGFLRAKNGTCIPQNQCPTPKCGKNERFELCPDSLCEPQRCSELGFSVPCPTLSGDFDCPGQPACICDYGFVRNDYGICIPKKQCPSCGGDSNAETGCGINCGRLCSNYNKGPVPCPRICKINSCDCKKGYVLDVNAKKCVRPQQCTPTCGNNEVYSTCTNGGCQAKNCTQLGKPVPCIKIDPKSCIKGCICREGYLRDKNGVCVPKDQCPRKCTGPNEHYSCGGACDNVCSTLSKQNQTNCPIVNKRCNNKCYCNEGYARDDNNICIPIEQCGVSCHGDSNAMPGCGDYCGKRCSNYNKGVVACPLICQLHGCDCKQSYVYDDNLKKCVQPKNCTPICGKDEDYSTCINGGCQKKKCDDLGKPDVCVRPKECIDGCPCKNGFLRTKNGTCVPVNQCPTPVCRKNETFDWCANGDCNRRKCSELVDPIICKDPIECIGDCVCVKGYLRNEDGLCILEKECKPKCKGLHQIFDFCPSTCPPRTCESLDRAYICPIEWGQEPPCQPGCVCEQGYYTNKKGECISEMDCPKCKKPHEYLSCGGACDNVCATLNEQNQTHCPIINIQCNSMCYCEEGYARNASNICIPIEDCPPPRCGSDERYEENPSLVCKPLYCSEVGVPMDCPPVVDANCDDEPACICKSGLVRNDAGDCVPIEECPSNNTTVTCVDARARLDKGSINLAGEFLHYLVSTKPDENSVASGSSLMIPLAQIALCATGSVLDELLKLLNLENTDQIKCIFPEFTKELGNQVNVDLEIATTCYANIGYPLSSNFIRDSKQYFDAEGENLDFSQNVAASKTINDWVSNRTRGKIQELVNPSMFSADTRLCLVNAIYFLGDWLYKFNPNNTEVKDFYKANGDIVPLKIMYQQGTFNYAENDEYQALEMFYNGKNISFLAVLPRNKTGLLDVVKTLRDPDVFSELMNNLQSQNVKVHLPKMSINTQTDLKEVLIRESIATAMFDRTNNGFEGILERKEPVYVSDAIQKAYLSLDEKGTVATAATAIIVGVTSAMYPPPKTYTFEATHSFAFYILLKSPDSTEKVPMFCGSFVGAE